jgi:hypothetical protein
MIEFFGRLMTLPVEAFVYSMEMLVKTMRGIQHIASQGIGGMVERDARAHVGASSERAVLEMTQAVSEEARRGRTGATRVTTQEEGRGMSDKDLRDDKLKLVRYKILFVKRNYEAVFCEVEELVADNTDTAAYTAWKIAEFIQRLGKEKKDIEVPGAWKDYPASEYIEVIRTTQPPYSERRMLTGFPEGDKKYLRVYYEVLERYEREKFKYEEEQIDILKDISETLKRDRGGTASSTASTSTSPIVTPSSTPPPRQP